MSVKRILGQAAVEVLKSAVSAFATTVATNVANRAVPAPKPPAEAKPEVKS